MNDDRTKPTNRPLKPSIGREMMMAAGGGGFAGAVVGLYFAVAVHCMSGLCLDGDPRNVSFVQTICVYLILMASGAGIGAAAFAGVVGMSLAALAAMRNIYCRFNKNRHSIGGGRPS